MIPPALPISPPVGVPVDVHVPEPGAGNTGPMVVVSAAAGAALAVITAVRTSPARPADRTVKVRALHGRTAAPPAPMGDLLTRNRTVHPPSSQQTTPARSGAAAARAHRAL